MTSKIEVKWFPEGSLNEIYQTTKMQFAFLSSEKTGHMQCHAFVLCRDFLHDAVKWFIKKTKDRIYGFEYAHGKNPSIDMEEMKMLVTKKAATGKEIAKLEDNMKMAKKLLNFYERMAGWKLSRLVKIEDKDKKRSIWLFRGSKKWLASPFLISMYTFIIRLGNKSDDIKFKNEKELMQSYKYIMEHRDKYKDERGNDNDASYLQDCYNKLGIILCNYKTLFKLGEDGLHAVYKTVDNKDWFHDRCGIVHLCQFDTPDKELNEEFKKLCKENGKG